MTRKRAARKGANICPTCEGDVVMRVVFVSKDVGGFTALPGFVGCPKCKVVRKVKYEDVEEVVTHRVVRTTIKREEVKETAVEKAVENVDMPQA